MKGKSHHTVKTIRTGILAHFRYRVSNTTTRSTVSIEFKLLIFSDIFPRLFNMRLQILLSLLISISCVACLTMDEMADKVAKGIQPKLGGSALVFYSYPALKADARKFGKTISGKSWDNFYPLDKTVTDWEAECAKNNLNSNDVFSLALAIIAPAGKTYVMLKDKDPEGKTWLNIEFPKLEARGISVIAVDAADPKFQTKPYVKHTNPFICSSPSKRGKAGGNGCASAKSAKPANSKVPPPPKANTKKPAVKAKPKKRAAGMRLRRRTANAGHKRGMKRLYRHY